MSDRSAEIENLGAEALPAGFADIDRVLQTRLETTPQHQRPRQQLELVGLVAIITRWLKNEGAT